MQYEKDFDGWNELKQKIDIENKEMTFHNREVWWCSIGVNVDCEECGKNEFFDRPVLVFQKLARNKFYGVPLSTQKQRFENFYYVFSLSGKEAYALLDQMRVYSTNRMIRVIGKISIYTYIQIKIKMFIVLGIEKIFPYIFQ